MGVIEDTVAKLSARLAELQPSVEEARRIEAALAVLTSSNGQLPKGDGKRPSTRGGKREAFIEYVKDHPDASTQEIADALHTKPSYVKTLKRKLIDGGYIKGGGGEPWTVLDMLKPVEDETPDHPPHE